MNRKHLPWYLSAALFLTMGASQSLAQKIDTEYVKRLRQYTTDEKFLPDAMLDIVDHPSIPSPLKHFGEIAGAPNIQHGTKDIYGYFAALAKSSKKLQWVQIGTSEEGRPIHLAIIANEKTMGRLDHYKKQLALLADPRKVSKDEVAKVIDDAKPVYYLNGGLHSPETGSPEMLMELAYRLITSTSEKYKEISDNIIVVINPVSEPDGWDRQTDWYNRYGKHRKNYEDGGMRNPPYWGKYTVHDNNRDGIQVSQELTKATMRAYFEWHPTVLLDFHESLPLLYISTGTGPYNETIDPITINEWQLLANYETTELAKEQMPGVFSWAFYDGWNPGYLFWIANNHNSIGRFYETFGNAGSNTFLRDVSTTRFAGDLVTSREWYRPTPITPKVMWSYRNNLNFMMTGAIAGLSYAAQNAKNLLENFYLKGYNSWQKGLTESPRLYHIPGKQRDPHMVNYLVNNLLTHGIEVHEVTSGQNAGDYVVLLDQPYRNHAVNLLSIQKFPKDAKYPSYDDVAWTLGYMYGVDVKEQDRLDFPQNSLKLLEGPVDLKGKVVGSGSEHYIAYKAQSQVLPLLYELKNKHPQVKAYIYDEKINLGGGNSLDEGSLYFEGLTTAQAVELAAKFKLDLLASNQKAQAKGRLINLPKIAVYHSWAYTQDEGWVRFTFDQMGIPYTSINKDNLKKGNLRSQFDVVIVPRIRGAVSDFIHEIDPKWGPMPYTKTPEFPSHGYPMATDDMTGGPGFDGIAELSKFVMDGGVILPFDNSAMLVSQTGIGRELKVANTGNLNHPGSIVRVKKRQMDSKILYGYPEVFTIFKGNGPLLDVDASNKHMMVLQYSAQTPSSEIEYSGPIMGQPQSAQNSVSQVEEKYPASQYPYLVSGMVQNENHVLGKSAIFNVPMGKGKVIAFTFNPIHRYLNHSDMPMVWNTLINWDSL